MIKSQQRVHTAQLPADTLYHSALRNKGLAQEWQGKLHHVTDTHSLVHRLPATVTVVTDATGIVSPSNCEKIQPNWVLYIECFTLDARNQAFSATANVHATSTACRFLDNISQT